MKPQALGIVITTSLGYAGRSWAGHVKSGGCHVLTRNGCQVEYVRVSESPLLYVFIFGLMLGILFVDSFVGLRCWTKANAGADEVGRWKRD
jgi:hypothetical protein